MGASEAAVRAGARPRTATQGQQQPTTLPHHPLPQVVRPAKLWCDVEAAPQAASLAAAWGDPAVVAAFTAPKVAWLAENEPEALDAAATICLPHDYVNLVLTGEVATDAGDASGTGYWDPKVRRPSWDGARVRGEGCEGWPGGWTQQRRGEGWECEGGRRVPWDGVALACGGWCAGVGAAAAGVWGTPSLSPAGLTLHLQPPPPRR